MAVASWRQKVSTSDGCKSLFESTNFKTDLVEQLDLTHSTASKLIQSSSVDSKTLDCLNEVILLYRTIRNLSSIKAQSEWIILQSDIIQKIIPFLSIVFKKSSESLSSPLSASASNDLFVYLCDIIRAAFQILCNLSFHTFSSNNNTHSAIWSHFVSSKSSSNYISWWINQLLLQTKRQQKDNLLIQTNMSRILEPICAFLHEFIMNHEEIIHENNSELTVCAIYNIQLIDVHYFGNNKNYLYQRVATDDDEEETKNSQEDDDFDRWKHHKYIRDIIPYFINANGLLFYIDNLTTDNFKLHYFRVCIELLFEMTESILIDIKTPSMKADVQLLQKKKVHLIQCLLQNTLQRLLSVIDYSFEHMFEAIFEDLDVAVNASEELISAVNTCQHILEILSNVCLISTSIENQEDMIKYQNDLMMMNDGGSIMIKYLRFLQDESDKLCKYIKVKKISDDVFNKQYEATITKILSYRRQIMSIISTLCCDNKLNQDFIRKNGAIEVLLNMTKIDPFTMFLQQWSIFAIKNITKNNLENQQYIQSIKAQKVVQSEEMKKMGVKVVYDEVTGKIVAKKDE